MDYTDAEFVAAFEAGTIESFHHSDHIRLALLYVRKYGMPEAEERVAEGIRRFSMKAGQPGKYHHTMTVAWVRLAAGLLDKEALSAYYSSAVLKSEQARREWVDPDLAALPNISGMDDLNTGKSRKSGSVEGENGR